MLRLEMLPAAHGDALLIEWGGPRARHRMLMDAGPLGTYRGIHDRIAALPKRDLDVLAVSHIDGDHIEGVVRLLQDRKALKLRLGDVWFNGWPQIAAKVDDVQGAAQGEMVGAMLTRDHQPWNQATKFDAMVVTPEEEDLPVIALPGDAKVTVLGPGPDQLTKLRRDWVSVMKEIGVVPGRVDKALELLAKRRDLSGIEDLQGGKTKLDSSVANAASIALLFEHDGKSLLLTGDSHGDVLAAGLRRLARQRGVDRVSVDAFKLQHHGSSGNVTDETLALVDTTRYLVSTNGARYHHPDAVAIRRILDGPTRRPDVGVELVFNYDSDTTSPWGSTRTQKRFGYTATFPESATAGAVLEV
jgi:hypothetical protein